MRITEAANRFEVWQMTCLVIYPADRCGDRFSFSIFCPTRGSPFSSVAGSVECSVESQSQISFSGNWLCWSWLAEREKEAIVVVVVIIVDVACSSDRREACTYSVAGFYQSDESIYFTIVRRDMLCIGSVCVCVCVCAAEATI